MNILITSVGSNTSIGIIKSLRTAGNIHIVGTDINEAHLCAGALLVDEFIVTPLASEKDRYILALLSIVENKSINCVIPVHDDEIEVAAEMKQKFPQITFWAVNSSEIISICNNKKLSNKKALEAELSVPKCYDKADTSIINFPVIIKPVNGVSSRGITIIKDRQELEKVLANAEDEVIIQEFIENAVEYTVDAYSSYSGKFYGCVVRERLETRNGMSIKGVVVEDEILQGLVEKFLNKMKYCGMSNIQFFRKKEKYFFIEINPRFSGAGVLSVAANFNSPAFTVLEAKGETLCPLNKADIKTGLFMTRYYEESFAYANHIIV